MSTDGFLCSEAESSSILIQRPVNTICPIPFHFICLSVCPLLRDALPPAHAELQSWKEIMRKAKKRLKNKWKREKRNDKLPKSTFFAMNKNTSLL
jgi:hypothetical protein